MKSLRSAFQDGTVLLFDGAMGTRLYENGVFINKCYDELNLSQLDLLREVELGVPRGRRPRVTDQHLWRQPGETGSPRAGGPVGGNQRRGS